MKSYFTNIPAGFTQHFGELLSLPKECVVCGDKASNKFKISRLYDTGAKWMIVFYFTYRTLSVPAPVCKKHFIQLTFLRYLFWILLLLIMSTMGWPSVIAESFTVFVIHFIAIAIFPFVAVKYLSTKGSVEIYKATRMNGITEVILSIMRKDYYEKVLIGGATSIPFPEPPSRLLIARRLLMALLFLPWVLNAIFITYDIMHDQVIIREILNR